MALKVVLQILCLVLVASAYPYFNQKRNAANYYSPSDYKMQPNSYAYYSFLRGYMKQHQSPVLRHDFRVNDLNLGMVTAVKLDSAGDLFIFHRASRVWGSDTFNDDNTLSEKAKIPIPEDTILKLNPESGEKLSGFGAGIFNMPHGLTMDSGDNIWVTDVGRHQVFRFPKGSTTPDLTLGEQFVPGDDASHFCKPTNVAVAKTGEFFVSDGYCNKRVMKFSKEGQLLKEWDGEAVGGMAFNVPHSLALVEDLDLICVADRDNNRSLCYNAGLHNGKPCGSFNRTLIPQGDIGQVFSLFYNKHAQNIAATGFQQPFRSADGDIVYPPFAYVYNLDGTQEDEWAYMTELKPNSLIHDICVSEDGQDFYLADDFGRGVYKYSKLPSRSRPFPYQQML